MPGKKPAKPNGEKQATGYLTGAVSQPGTRKKEPRAKTAPDQRGTASWIVDEMVRYEKKFGSWEKRASEIVTRYRDEREGSQLNSPRACNVLWSNVQVLKPTLYAHAPKAEIVRRYKDADPIARTSCEVAERATDYEIDCAGLDDLMQACVLDRLLGGRGTSWVTYAPTIKGDGADRVKDNDQLALDYVDLRDFGHIVRPTWRQVDLVWRWKYFTRQEFIDQFGEANVDKVEFKDRRDTEKASEDEEPMARVAEVWDKVSKRVYWVSKTVADYLDDYDDPLHLTGFFPCPAPLYATMTNNTLVPVPDFYLYQDQANEVDKLTGRINRLTDALKVTGVYDQSFKALEDLMAASGVADNTLVPVSMEDLTGKGGLKMAVQLVDISVVITTLQACYVARQQAIDTIYQITGIADVLRGAVDPNKKLGQSQLEAQFGGTRIKDMQQDVARFSRDIVRIMAEIIVEMYDPKKLWDMTNAAQFVGKDPQTGQPNTMLFAQALKLLRDDKLRSYRVDIETDSTIALDETQSKQEAIEFMTVMGGAIEKALPMAQAMPAAIPFVQEAILFVARRFKAGRGLEGAIEKMGEGLAQQAQQPKPPSPEQMKAQADMQKTQAQVRLAEIKGQIAMAQGQQKLQLEREKAALEARVRVFEAQQEAQIRQQEFEQDRMQDSIAHQQNLAQDAQRAQLTLSLAAAKPANGRAA